MMKNITFSADEHLIEQARRRAATANTTLNELFRSWLARYVAEPGAGDRYQQLMTRLRHVRTDSSFTREQMNERS
jgi:hypothetical protein